MGGVSDVDEMDNDDDDEPTAMPMPIRAAELKTEQWYTPYLRAAGG